VLREAHLQRLERAVAPHLRAGWTRAVFAAPQTGEPAHDKPERVLDGPGAGVPPTPEQLTALFSAARAAANAGLIKQTYVLDAHRRVQIDARHGRPAVRTLDDDTARKVMGGKDRALRPDTSNDLLRAIGIMNADGTISANHARKYKQVNHLAELARPTWERLVASRTRDEAHPLRVLDLACGNAYLSFVLAESLRLAGVPLRLHGVDVRDDVVARSRERAAQLGMPHLGFARATIAEAETSALTALGGPPDIVLALHACDTATDEALALAIRLGAPAILCVPCCQHELAAQLATNKSAILEPLTPDPAAQAAANHAPPTSRAGKPPAPPTQVFTTGPGPLPAGVAPPPPPPTPAPAMLRHGLLRGAYADLLTDSLRVEILEACGYDVAVVEFVASEHTAKNLLLRAHRRHPNARLDSSRWQLAPISARCAQLGVHPDLLRRLTAVTPP
jgi:SAM-dependent methyltransferase